MPSDVDTARRATMTRMAMAHEPALTSHTGTGREKLPTLTAWAAGVLGCAGTAIILWEVSTGPTTTPDGIVQDHGGYLLGVPLLLAAVVAALTLVAGRRSEDRTTRSGLYVFAMLSVCAPLLAMAVATASGMLTFDLLTFG
jgi:hypothetical protein